MIRRRLFPSFVFAIGVFLFSVLQISSAAATKPNVIVIFTDDHGYADLGVQGVDRDVRTPHLDQLARDGVRFTRGYVTAPQCVPSRAGLLTGRYQQKFGVEDNPRGPLPLGELTIAERLKHAGYVTGMAGKWHLDIGMTKESVRESRILREHMPHMQGFDEYWRGEQRQYYASHDLSGKPFADAPHLVSDTRFRVNVQTEAALGFLDRRAATPDQPWFLYLAWMAPHVPLESPEPWFSKTPASLPMERRQALAMIAALDDGLGKVRARLKTMNAETNTLIFFISDNGAPVKPGAWDGSLNTPLIGEKGMLTEGGVRVPFLAAWPGTLPAGKVFDAPVISLDVAATVNAIADLPPDFLDGVNLMPFLTGKSTGKPHDFLFWRWRSQAAVLSDRWKFIMLGRDRRYLFDLESPEGEAKNRLEEFPQIAAHLESKLTPWTATLKPPGLAAEVSPAERDFFAAHVDKSITLTNRRGTTTPVASAGGGSVQGWLGRNCNVSQKNEALLVEPVAGSKGGGHFITQNGMDVAGPLDFRIRLRSPTGGEGRIEWRLAGQDDFREGNSAPFQIQASGDWQDAAVRIPGEGRIIHVRLHLPGRKPMEIQSIRAQPITGPSGREWLFGGPK